MYQLDLNNTSAGYTLVNQSGDIPPARGLCWASGLLCSSLLYKEGLTALLSS